MKSMDDKTRILMLKLFLGASIVNGAILAWQLRQVTAQSERLIRRARLIHGMLNRYAQLADPAVSQQVLEEFEFDMIVRDLDDLEFKEESR